MQGGCQEVRGYVPIVLEQYDVRVEGRADVPGHPLQYGTTKQFLDHFGLARVDDLPRDSELAKD